MESKIEKEYKLITSNSAWPTLYYEIGKESSNLLRFRITEAYKPENQYLNKCNEIIPYDYCRVKLERIENDYINASIVKVTSPKSEYIVTQAPLSETAGHFWLMVLQQNTKNIIMLNNLIENGEIKCYQYWPDENRRHILFNNEQVAVIFINQKYYSNYIIRKFSLKDIETNEYRIISQFHYIGWSDLGRSVSADFFDFMQKINERRLSNLNNEPDVVHCCSGSSRSGIFCVMDSTLKIMEKDRVDDVDIKQLIKKISSQRKGLLRYPRDLRIAYELIIEGMKQLDLNNTQKFEDPTSAPSTSFSKNYNV